MSKNHRGKPSAKIVSTSPPTTIPSASRRAFLIGLITAGTVGIGKGILEESGTAVYRGGATIVHSLWQWFGKTAGLGGYDYDLLGHLFGNLSGYVGYAGGKLKAFNGVHPDNIVAAEQASAIWNLSQFAEKHRLKVCQDDALEFCTDQDLLLIGGPISNDLVREQFGYHGEVDVLRQDSLHFKLPYSIRCNRNECHRWPTKRFLNGEVHKSPRYYVEGSSGQIFAPDRTAEGFLKNDYLVISRLPNVIGLEGRVDPRLSGHNVLCFQGVHGTATRSLNLLCSDKALLQEFEASLPRTHYFQAVFRTGIAHDRKLSIPQGRLELLGVEEVVLLHKVGAAHGKNEMKAG